MVERDRVDRVEMRQVVLVRRIVAVPSHNVKRGVILLGLKQKASVLVDNLEGLLLVRERSHGGLEVTTVRQSVGSNGTQIGKGPGAVEDFADVSATTKFHERVRVRIVSFFQRIECPHSS